jgi:putative ABC transport system substrate-binding protein
MALLIHSANPGVETETKAHQNAAQMLGCQLHVLRAGTEDEIASAFAALTSLGVEALVIAPDNFFNTRNEQLATLALRYRVPAIFNDRAFAVAGGLVGYGASITEQYRLVGLYVGRILMGEKPSDLPVQQSSKVDLTINLNTAKLLGLSVPPTLLARADEVIE